MSSFTGMLPSPLLLLPALLAQEPPPATYRGVPAAEWLQRLQRGGGDEPRPQVSWALRELAIGDAAVARQLTQLLTSGELRVRRTAAWAAEHRCAVPFLIEALDDADGEVRRNATITLARLGAAAADATPHLVQRLARAEGDLERHAAAEALALIGTAHADALPALLGLVRDDADSTSSVRTLLTNHGATAVPLLQPLLQQPGRAVAAADILLDLAEHHPVAIAAIEAVATGDDALQFRLLEWKARRNHAAVPEFVRWFAHRVDLHTRRGGFGLDLRLDAEASTMLATLLDDEDARVRVLACELGMRATAPLPRIVPRLVERLADDDGSVRFAAVRALATRAVDAPALCLQELITAATRDPDTPDDRLPRLACLALGPLAASHAGARHVLQQLAREDTPAGACAALALARHLPEHEDRTGWLRRALADDDVGREASELPGAQDPAAATTALRAATAVLAAPHEADDGGRRVMALARLARIGASAAPAATLIAQHFDHRDVEVNRVALWAVRGVARRCPELFPAVFTAARTRTADPVAIEVLGSFGEAARPALPLLRELLAHRDQARQRAASHALRDIGAAGDDLLLAVLAADDPGSDGTGPAYFAAEALIERGAAAWPALQRALAADSPVLRGWALECLGRIDALHDRAPDHVRAGLRDAHWFVRGRAVRQLDVLGDAGPPLAPFLADPDGYVRSAARDRAERLATAPRQGARR